MIELRRFVTPLLLLFLALGSAESQILDRIIKNGELRVGVSGNQPPFNTKDRSGELMGLEIDLANMMAAAFGVKATFVTKPFGELLAGMDAGELDVVMSGMAITPKRSLRAEFVGPYMLSGKSILTNSRALAAAKEAGDLNRANVKLAALENSTSQEFAEKALPQAQLITVKDYDAGVQMVVNDEVDALVADMPICVLSVMRYPNKGLATLTEPFTIEPIGIAMPSSDARLKSLVENYMKAFEATGLVDELRKKWLEDGSWVAALP